ncbi:MAG TPA: hypothetical protein VM865_07490 [Acidobacteriaceae bacterium]|nr:hypothetical protein [Acidobacteriaceae bacterium]
MRHAVLSIALLPVLIAPSTSCAQSITIVQTASTSARPPVVPPASILSAPVAHRFPYTFSNFAWWTEAQLRSELQRRIPSLGEDLEPGSLQASRVRETLTAMLQEKGIKATVLTVEPSATSTSVSDFMATLPFFIPESNGKRPHIAFTISEPAISVGAVSMQVPPLPQSSLMARIAAKIEGKPFDSGALPIQARQLADPLQRDGYLSAAVKLVAGRPERKGDGYIVPLTATVETGPVYHVGMVSADGGPLLRDRDLSAYFDVQPGELASPYAFQRLESSIMTVYFQAGYPAVHFQDKPVLDSEHATANYRLQVIAGPQYRLRTVKVTNLSPAQEAEVRKILALGPGDIYDQIAIDELHEKVAANAKLHGLDYSFAPQTDRQNNVIDLTLDFFNDTAQSSL